MIKAYLSVISYLFSRVTQFVIKTLTGNQLWAGAIAHHTTRHKIITQENINKGDLSYKIGSFRSPVSPVSSLMLSILYLWYINADRVTLFVYTCASSKENKCTFPSRACD